MMYCPSSVGFIFHKIVTIRKDLAFLSPTVAGRPPNLSLDMSILRRSARTFCVQLALLGHTDARFNKTKDIPPWDAIKYHRKFGAYNLLCKVTLMHF